MGKKGGGTVRGRRRRTWWVIALKQCFLSSKWGREGLIERVAVSGMMPKLPLIALVARLW